MFRHTPHADMSTLASRAAQQAIPRRGSMVAKLEAKAPPMPSAPSSTPPRVTPSPKPALVVLPKSKPAPALSIVKQAEAAVVSAWQVAASKIVVIGAGGAGGNAVSRMIDQPTETFEGIRFCVANTDLQALNKIECDLKIALGPKVTKGLGAGGRSEVGAQAAEESLSAIEGMIGDADLVFITLGLGGGTGSGAAPVIARIARDKGAVVVAIATLPFAFEGTQRGTSATHALETLRAHADTVVVVNNNALFSLFEKGRKNVTLPFAFSVADQCLQQAVDGMVGIIRHPGTINLDFADVRATLAQGGRGYFGMGMADGENAAAKAMEKAMSSHLLGSSGVSGAKKVLVYFRGDACATDIAEAMNRLDGTLDLECDTFFGYGPDVELGDQVEVTLFAVGVNEAPDIPVPNRTSTAKPRSAEAPDTPVAITIPAFAEAVTTGRAPNVIEAPAPRVVSAPPKVEAVRAEPDAPTTASRSRESTRDKGEVKKAVPTPPTLSDLPSFLVRGREKGDRKVKHSYHLTTDQTDHCFSDDLDVPAFLRRRAQR